MCYVQARSDPGWRRRQPPRASGVGELKVPEQLGVLSAMKAPTVSQVADQEFYAAKTVVPKATISRWCSLSPLCFLQKIF
jgi:hypothetical protein